MALLTERREARRYPVAAEAEYRLVSEEKYSSGLVRDLSNTGLLLDCQPALEPGRAIELSIRWPAAQWNGGRIHLHATGQTIRAGEGYTAVKIDDAVFRFEG